MSPTLADRAFLRELHLAGGTMAGVLAHAAASPKSRAVKAGWATRSTRHFTAMGLPRSETVYTLTDEGRRFAGGGR